MRDMKDSGIPYIGEIPKECDLVNIKNVICLLPKSKIQAGEGIKDGKYPFYTSSNLLTKKINVKLYDADAITMGTGGMASVNYSDKDFSTSTDCLNFKTRINTKFVYYSLLCQLHVINELGFAGTGLKHLNKKFLMSFPLLSFSMMAQDNIVLFLNKKVSTIDNIIEKTKESIEEYKKLKQSIITEIVTRGLNPNVKMKDSGIDWIGEIPEYWSIRKLGNVSEIQTGPFGSQLHNDDYADIGTPIITVEHFGEMELIHENMPLVSDEDVKRLSKYVMKDGDLIFSRVGSVDRCVIVSEKESGWLFSGRCLRVRLGTDIYSPYINYCFSKKSFKEFMGNVAVGATMASINTSILSEVMIPVPPYSEQREISENLRNKTKDLNSFIHSKELLINELESYKKSLIYEVVTGKKEIPIKEVGNLGL